MFFLQGLCLLIILECGVYGQFNISEVTLEAFEPAGFRASISAEPGIELFGFHGKLNKEIQEIEPGDFTEDVKTANDDGYFTYYNPTLKLKEGDIVNYWIFVQHNQLGYRKDAQRWVVRELRKEPGAGCPASITEVSDRTSVCANTVVFEDNFDGESLDAGKWIWEQYIPTVPDYEFCNYKKDNKVTFLKDGQLYIKPKLIDDEEELKKTVDLSDGCTRPSTNSSQCINPLYIIQNPIISGRITSKLLFSYGEFEVKAKLPAGDWIIPHIFLEDEKNHRIWIAYSRGNAALNSLTGSDIGGTLLFGGPMVDHVEPKRSVYLTSYRSKDRNPFSASAHVFKVKWTTDKIELYIDGSRYGVVETGSLTNSGFTGKRPTKVRIVLGVGVGGITDFPDGFLSGSNTKPWRNRNTLQVKSFWNSRDTWYNTWNDQASQLQIDYIKVTAV